VEAPGFIVVGGGLAGLMATIKIAEAGGTVDLFSVIPVRRSHSVCAQGGINGAVNIKGENDSPEIHFVDTVRGGDFLAHQPLAKGMCYAAPDLIYLLDRMGVMFNRTAEGNLDFRRFGGTLYHRTAFAGATTGQQILYALDEQVRRFESEGRVRKREHWEYVGLLRDDAGTCRGIVAIDMRSMEVKAFPAAASMLATGGPGLLFGRTTNSMINTGSAASSAYQEGVLYANPEMIQVHPTAIPGEDKLRLMSESARGEGGRIWVPKQKGDTRPPKQIPETERWYFLEEKYPRYGNLVPRDVASREIYEVCVNRGMGLEGRTMVYLDLTHIDRATLDRKLGGILDIYEKFTGVDPREEPMKIFPAVHYSMGGLWTDYEATADGLINEDSPRNQQTNIPGLFAAGEVDYQYHGANRLGANSLLSCLYAGIIGGKSMVRYSAGAGPNGSVSAAAAAAERRWKDRFREIASKDGPENPYRLHQELGDLLNEHVTIVRHNAALKKVYDRLGEMSERWKRIGSLDRSSWANPAILFANQLRNMLELGKAVTLGAIRRDESRGAHFKPEFPQRDDARFLKTTLAAWSPDGPVLSYQDVDTSLVKPVARKYD
jgi:succinate dehydrogenase / fumarate reductase flavoprotein subunit